MYDKCVTVGRYDFFLVLLPRHYGVYDSFLVLQIYIHFYAVLQICLWDSWRVCFNVRHVDIDQWPLTLSGISHYPFQRYTSNSLLYIWWFLWDSDSFTVFVTGSFADGTFSLWNFELLAIQGSKYTHSLCTSRSFVHTQHYCLASVSEVLNPL